MKTDLDQSGGTLRSHALLLLLDALSTFAIAIPITLFIHLAAVVLWRTRVNRRYYAYMFLHALPIYRKELAVFDASAEKGSAATTRSKRSPAAAARQPRFRAFPSLLVFPNLLSIVVVFFLTGLVQKAVALLAADHVSSDVCGARCTWPAYAVLAGVVVFLAMSLLALCHFNARHRTRSWTPTEPPTDANDVEDPAYRWLSRLRARCGARVIDRDRGAFERPDGEGDEPERTERLLRRPLMCLRSTAADARDALTLAWLAKARGSSMFVLSFSYILLVGQLLLAALAGTVAAIPPGSSLAVAQLWTMLSLQLALATYCLCVGPAADRVESLVVGLQFAVEGSSTVVVLYAQLEDQLELMEYVFPLVLVAMGLPILQKLYDAVIVQLSRLCRRDDFSARSAFFALLALLIALPGAIMQFAGMKAVEVGHIESAADEAAATSEIALADAHNAGHVVGVAHDLLGAAAEAASEGLSLLYWLARPRAEHHAAADKIRHAYTRHRRRSSARASSVDSEAEESQGGRGASARLAALVQLARSKSSGSSVGDKPSVRFHCLSSEAAAAAEDDAGYSELAAPLASPNRPITPISPMLESLRRARSRWAAPMGGGRADPPQEMSHDHALP